MNTLEVVVWAIYLSRYVWTMESTAHIKNQIMFAGYAAKEYLNDNLYDVNQSIE
jgi:hypothetical protein